jgi:hypothetical protein
MRPRSSTHCRLAKILFLLVVLCACHTGTASDRPQDTQSNLIHGTIVVAVSTKDGFVLAGDSQGTDTSNCKALPGDYEKAFSVGERGGIIIAGLIGSSDAERQLRVSVAKALHGGDELAHNAGVGQPSVATIIVDFVDAVREAVSLVDNAVQLNSPLAAASAVSISDKGIPEWITVVLAPIHQSYAPGEEHWQVKVKQFIDPPDSRVIALGSGSIIVQQLLDRDGPDPALPDSQQEIMRRYYLLKTQHRLGELTLAEGEQLAPMLVHAAISFANAHPEVCFGIGGDVQVVTITAKGPRWVAPLDKSKVVPLEADFIARVQDSPMYGELDGIQWLRGMVPADAKLFYSGTADAVVVEPKFEGRCTFEVLPGAEKRMPATVSKLESALGGHCDVYGQTSSGRNKIATAPVLPPQQETPLCVIQQ